MIFKVEITHDKRLLTEPFCQSVCASVRVFAGSNMYREKEGVWLSFTVV